jgi:small nuclear ribonucleoprotein (snRNP)-like protein
VELKNDIQIRGTLKSVDQYLNIKLDDIQVVEELKYPHLVRTSSLGGAEPQKAWQLLALYILITFVHSPRSRMSLSEAA